MTDDQHPPLTDLIGLDPNFTGGKSVDDYLRDQRCSDVHLTDEQLTEAIMRALPIDHDDHSTVTRITLNEQTDSRNVIWGRPEWLAAEILASIRSAEMEAS